MNGFILFALLLIGAYLLGSVPAAYLIARWTRGVDIRKHGSGNVGASNVLTVTSKRWSLIVIVYDIAKGILPVYIARWLNLPVYQEIIIGLGAIAGHNWPVFLRFNGGRGILAIFGVVFALAPWLAVILTAFCFILMPFGLFSIGILLGLLLLPVLSWFASQPFHIEKSLALTLGLAALVLLSLIRRLTARRTPLSATVSTGELILNRLLFDRDIRDKKAWLSQEQDDSTAKSR